MQAQPPPRHDSDDLSGHRAAFEVTWPDVADVLLFRMTRPFVILSFLVLVGLMVDGVLRGLHSAFDRALAFGPLAFACVALGIHWMTAHSEFRGTRPTERQYEYVFTDQQVLFRSPVAEARFSWEFFAAWTETRHAILMCQRPTAWRTIPKRAFTSPAELDAVRELLAAKLPRL